MLALICALDEEMAGLKKVLPAKQVGANDCAVFRAGSDCLLVRTGMGRDKAERAARQALSTSPVDAVVSFGFCGALKRELEVGELVLVSAQCAETHELSGDARLLALAAWVFPQAPRLKGVTAARLVTTPEAKRGLGLASGAAFVDMEGYWLAKLAAEKGLPFLAVRSVFDALDTDMTLFAGLDGRRGAALYLLGHPWQAGRLLGLRRDVLRAQCSLTRFVLSFLAAYKKAGVRA